MGKLLKEANTSPSHGTVGSSETACVTVTAPGSALLSPAETCARLEKMMPPPGAKRVKRMVNFSLTRDLMSQTGVWSTGIVPAGVMVTGNARERML